MSTMCGTGGFGSFCGQGYSYATLTTSGDPGHEAPRRRGSLGATRGTDITTDAAQGRPRRKSDHYERRTAKNHHHHCRAETANYGSLRSGLTMPRIPLVCNRRCPNEGRPDCPTLARLAPMSANKQQMFPRARSKRSGNKDRSSRPAVVERIRSRLSSDRARVGGDKARRIADSIRFSDDRAPPERKQHLHCRSHDSNRSGRSVHSKTSTRSRTQTQTPTPLKVQRVQPPPPKKAAKVGSGWSCFGS